MRRWSLALRLVVPVALVALIGLLASLEYRWLDEVSRAELDERRASLHQRAEDFAADVDREISQLYVMAQGENAALENGDGPALAHALDRWRTTSHDPRMLRGIYVARPSTAGVALTRYDPDYRTFVAADWPPALAPIRARLKTSATSTTPIASFLADQGFSIDASIPAIVVTLARKTLAVGTGPDLFLQSSQPAVRAILWLDRDELRTTFLPSLAERYFPARDADSYRFAIVDPADPAHPVLSRGFPSGTIVDQKKADASVTLLSMRLDLVTDVARRELVATTSRMANGKAGAVSGRGAGGGAVAAGAGGRGAWVESDAQQTPRTPSAGVARGTMEVFVQSSTTPDARLNFTTRTGQITVRQVQTGWQLVLQHSAGSLDAAVAAARRRNLWLSFGLLALVSAGVVLIVTNAQRAERLASRQMDFVATVTHELRTPLAVIRSAAQNLSDGVIERPDRAREYGQLIEAEGRRLTDMVEQVLEYAGLESGARVTAPRLLNAGEIVREAVAACQSLVPAEPIVFDVSVESDLPQIVAHEDALRRAVQNLVANAIKYGAAGGWIGVTTRRVASRGHHEIQIVVSDHGPGIDAADLPHLFEPFFRGRKALDAQIHGSGLGLSLVARIARAYGGRVTVKSSPGHGASFTLALPVARVHALRPYGRPAASADVPSAG